MISGKLDIGCIVTIILILQPKLKSHDEVKKLRNQFWLTYDPFLNSLWNV